MRKNRRVVERNERHGMSFTRLYSEWRTMRQRCGLTKCSNASAKKYYVDKGITVCDAWNRFSVFAKWALANGYADDLTLDRKRNSQGYKPSNCRWVSMKENLSNSSIEKAEEIRRLYRDSGESQFAIAATYGVSQSAISRVVNDKRWAP